jgi:hypothetical protein
MKSSAVGLNTVEKIEGVKEFNVDDDIPFVSISLGSTSTQSDIASVGEVGTAKASDIPYPL